MTKMTPLLIRLEPELIVALDRLRGDVPRVAFIRGRLAEMLGRAPKHVGNVTPVMRLGDGPGKPPNVGSGGKPPPAPKVEVQFGPVKRSAGSLAKPSKR